MPSLKIYFTFVYKLLVGFSGEDIGAATFNIKVGVGGSWGGDSVRENMPAMCEFLWVCFLGTTEKEASEHERQKEMAHFKWSCALASLRTQHRTTQSQ